MKLGIVNQAIRSMETVRDRPDRHDGNERRKQKEKEKDQKQEPAPTIQVTDQKVVEAIQSFQSDAQNQANGLRASMAGQGPGLKVVLTDGRGAVIRQFTGEEFVQMRDAVSREGRARGKILDQKL